MPEPIDLLSQPLGRLPQAVGSQRLQGLHDLVMQGAPSLVQDKWP